MFSFGRGVISRSRSTAKSRSFSAVQQECAEDKVRLRVGVGMSVGMGVGVWRMFTASLSKLKPICFDTYLSQSVLHISYMPTNLPRKHHLPPTTPYAYLQVHAFLASPATKHWQLVQQEGAIAWSFGAKNTTRHIKWEVTTACSCCKCFIQLVMHA